MQLPTSAISKSQAEETRNASATMVRIRLHGSPRKTTPSPESSELPGVEVMRQIANPAAARQRATYGAANLSPALEN